MWGQKPPGLGQSRKDKEAAKQNQPLYDSGSSERPRSYTGEMNECPYCNSTNMSSIDGGRRRQCNSCCTSYSSTVGTEYHKSHLTEEQRNLLKEYAREGISVRDVADRTGINKNTVNRYFKIFEEKGGRQLEEAMNQDSVEARQIENFKRLQKELLEEQD